MADSGAAGLRVYIVFGRGQPLRFLSHLDMLRLWERAMRRARLPLRYSQGFHPHPRLSLASPLAVGMTAAAEWLEAELRIALPPNEIRSRLAAQLPDGVTIEEVVEARWRAPSLAGRLQASEYEVEIRQPPPRPAVQEQVRRFLETASWPVEEERKGRRRTIDLRQFVAEVEVGEWQDNRGHLRLVLRHGPAASARPESILRAWGLGPTFRLHRKRLLFAPEPDEVVVQ